MGHAQSTSAPTPEVEAAKTWSGARNGHARRSRAREEELVGTDLVRRGRRAVRLKSQSPKVSSQKEPEAAAGGFRKSQWRWGKQEKGERHSRHGGDKAMRRYKMREELPQTFGGSLSSTAPPSWDRHSLDSRATNSLDSRGTAPCWGPSWDRCSRDSKQSPPSWGSSPPPSWGPSWARVSLESRESREARQGVMGRESKEARPSKEQPVRRLASVDSSDAFDTSCEEEEEKEPKRIQRPRRAAISAEATGAHNPRRAGKMPPTYAKTPEQDVALRKALEDCPFFKGLQPDIMAMLVGAMPIEDIPAGQKIIQQGDIGSEAFVLLSGECWICDEQGSAHIYGKGEKDNNESESFVRVTSTADDRKKFLGGKSHSTDFKKSRVGIMKSGSFFGEIAMLWGALRTVSVIAKEGCVLATLDKTDYTDVVVLQSIAQRNQRTECLRRVKLLETLQDEQITRLVDAFEVRVYEENVTVIKQGDHGDELFVVQDGECSASIRTGASDDADSAADVQEHRRYGPGELFGERALMHKTRRAATVKTCVRTELLVLDRRKFERLLGSLNELGKAHYLTDPRKDIAEFYRKGDIFGPRGSLVYAEEAVQQERAARFAICGSTDWFSVYRPTSKDAISKMLSGNAVGKGLNVKGKSAKRGRLSGFVPFLQIHDNKHKKDIEASPRDSWFEVYYTDPTLREHARTELLKAIAVLKENEQNDKAVTDGSSPRRHHRHHSEPFQLSMIDEYIEISGVYGLDVPEQALRRVYIDEPDLSFLAGWETGRNSEPAFMDMNFHSLRDGREPKVVLFQIDKENPMNPQGLLIAYAEHKVKPVVSDFDTFLVGSRGVIYEELPRDQAGIASWALEQTQAIMESPSEQVWTARWLEVLKKTDFHPETPQYGFGDPMSYRLTSEVVEATLESGGVRHGAECFNFFCPQELDEEYLVVWEMLPDKPWTYLKEEPLRNFLLERASEGFSFPLNPVWAVRDPGWYKIYEVLQSKVEAAMNWAKWFPEASGILEKIERLHERFPDGFQRGAAKKDRNSKDKLQAARSKLQVIHQAAKPLSPNKQMDVLLHRRRRPNAALKGEV